MVKVFLYATPNIHVQPATWSDKLFNITDQAEEAHGG